MPNRRENVREADRLIFKGGRYEKRTFRNVRKTEELDCRSSTERTLSQKATDLDVEYQNFGRYLIDYMGMKDRLYSAGMEKAILQMVDIHWGGPKGGWEIAPFRSNGRGRSERYQEIEAYSRIRRSVSPEFLNGEMGETHPEMDKKHG